MRILCCMVLVFLVSCVHVLAIENASWADLMDQTNALFQAKKLDEAIQTGTAALTLAEKEFGPSTKEVAFSMTNLAYIQLLKGNTAEAEKLCLNSLAITEKISKPNDPEIAVALYNLAEVYKTQKKYSEAEPLYERSLTISEKSLGSEDMYTIAAVQSLVEIYKATGRESKATALLAEHGQK